ncbi:hypothetical protein L917_14715 [Phytophthora nicotianae]|uniref:Uncharacterized protein n=1 Tax=Phytophthora nicotianae TaxID=4792 RepID=W2KME2_PHYNI|nr:hypothetical protein L915_15001 [Phytophthora nicotianae]ETL32534.1 hypothetical protein L916_14899 [Phytophthora nicotianae]ETL85789.1 hypothetical protein L917_14715 [Phytophthora nicotianae]ETM38942.1 hypothetical protein L914_14851 [Phytophthora nicotianae]
MLQFKRYKKKDPSKKLQLYQVDMGFQCESKLMQCRKSKLAL